MREITRAQVDVSINRLEHFSAPHGDAHGDNIRAYLAQLEARVGVLEGLLARSLRFVEADAQMAADLSRFRPFPPEAQEKHNNTEWESEGLLPLMRAALAGKAAP